MKLHLAVTCHSDEQRAAVYRFVLDYSTPLKIGPLSVYLLWEPEERDPSHVSFTASTFVERETLAPRLSEWLRGMPQGVTWVLSEPLLAFDPGFSSRNNTEVIIESPSGGLVECPELIYGSIRWKLTWTRVEGAAGESVYLTRSPIHVDDVTAALRAWLDSVGNKAPLTVRWVYG